MNSGKSLSLSSIKPLLQATVCAAALLAVAPMLRAETPDIGSKAPGFTLSTPEGKPVSLASLEGHHEVVLIVLRGYPGYQCPYCVRQVHDFEVHAKEFAEHKAELLLVYPGPQGQLDEHAKEFLSKEDALPANFHLVIDPDYQFTNQYDLRWDAPHETAYPATFLIDRKGKIFFRKISHSHGDRTTAEEVLAELDKRK
jgi:peroxiredoxin